MWTYSFLYSQNIVWFERIQKKKREGSINNMTGEKEIIQLESDHGGVEVKERSCTSFQLKRKRKMADNHKKKKKQVKKIKKEPVEGTETLLDKWLYSYKPSTIEFNEKVAVETVEPEHGAFILKQTKCNSECKVDFYYFAKTKTILKDGKLSTRQKMRCLVEEEDVKRENFFKTKRNKQKERMRQRHLLRRQEVTPRRVRLVTHILDTLKKVNV